MKHHVGIIVAALAALSVPQSAQAATPIIENDTLELELGGFASSVMGVQQIPYADGLIEEFSGLNSGVFRLEWKGNVTEHTAFEVHNRFYWSLTNLDVPTEGLVGLGATVAPPRTFDLKTVIIDNDGMLFEHDIDRLAVTGFTPWGDVTAGRQAITWGVASMFVVADIWSQFSPFELDTSQKRGIDAVRHISYPFETVEMDLILADRGSWEDFSFGARWSWTMDFSDQYFAIAKSFRRVWAMMGTALDADYWRPYAEVSVPFDLDDAELKLPRATIGADYIRSNFTLSMEYHFNGYGTNDSAEYAQTFSSPEFSRGEFYFVGRHYAGASAIYMPVEWFQFILGGSMNLLDPSAVLFPFVNYEIVQDVNLRGGAYLAVGEQPQLVPPQLNSEFGSYGNFYFIELSAFF